MANQLSHLDASELGLTPEVVLLKPETINETNEPTKFFEGIIKIKKKTRTTVNF